MSLCFFVYLQVQLNKPLLSPTGLKTSEQLGFIHSIGSFLQDLAIVSAFLQRAYFPTASRLTPNMDHQTHRSTTRGPDSPPDRAPQEVPPIWPISIGSQSPSASCHNPPHPSLAAPAFFLREKIHKGFLTREGLWPHFFVILKSFGGKAYEGGVIDSSIVIRMCTTWRSVASLLRI